MKRLLIFTILAAFALSGCRSIRYVEVPGETVTLRDSVEVVKTVRDSVYELRHIYERGDTVYVYDTKFRERIVRDTIATRVEVPVEVPVPYEVRVEEPTPWWQRGLAMVGAMTCLGIFGGILVLTLKSKL